MASLVPPGPEGQVPEPRAFDDALRVAREALEGADREAKARAAEIVRRAEEEARAINAEAERRAQQRAEEIVRQAEDRARVLPAPSTKRLTALLEEIREASNLLGEARSRVEDLLRGLGEGSAATRVAAPVTEEVPLQPLIPPGLLPTEAPPAPEPSPTPAAPPRPARPGAQTIVRGLRAQIIGGEVVPMDDPPAEQPPEPKRNTWPFR